MPEAGRDGWYTDWWNGGDGGVPAWETFHLSEVRDIIERDWRAGDGRVIAGLSMGGYGTMHYATAQSELFKAAAAFSGVLDPVGTDSDFGSLLWRSQDRRRWSVERRPSSGTPQPEPTRRVGPRARRHTRGNGRVV